MQLLPDCLSTLGLSRQPFSEVEKEHDYFLDSNIQSNVSTLLQQLHGQGRPVLVVGEHGIGKSSLLNYLRIRESAGFHFIYLACSADTSVMEVDYALRRNLPGLLTQKVGLPDLLKTLNGVGMHPVLLLDDAHTLDITVLSSLLTLQRDMTYRTASLEMILAGDERLESNIAQLEGSYSDLRKIPVVNMKTLHRSSILHYLNLRLDHAGQNQQQQLIAQAEAYSLYDSSGGVPGTINTLAVAHLKALCSRGVVPNRPSPNERIQKARQELSRDTDYIPPQSHDQTEINEPQSRFPFSPRLMGLVLGGSFLILLFGSMLFKAFDDEPLPAANSAYNDHNDSTQKLAIPKRPSIPHDAPPPPEPPKVDIPAKLSDEELPPFLLALREDAVNTPASNLEDLFEEEDQTPQNYNDEIYRFAADEIMLQLLGTHNRPALDAFIQQHQLNDAIMLPTDKNGQIWYLLLQGPYANRTQARNAIKRLPAAIQKQKPWPRNVADLQKIAR